MDLEEYVLLNYTVKDISTNLLSINLIVSILSKWLNKIMETSEIYVNPLLMEMTEWIRNIFVSIKIYFENFNIVISVYENEVSNVTCYDSIINEQMAAMTTVFMLGKEQKIFNNM